MIFSNLIHKVYNKCLLSVAYFNFVIERVNEIFLGLIFDNNSIYR